MSAFVRLGLRPEPAPNQKDDGLSGRQHQVRDTFSYKWARRDTYESDITDQAHRRWMIDRYCCGDMTQVAQWLSGPRKIIVDAGCGSGWSASLFFGALLREHDYLGIDVSDSVEIARQRFREMNLPGDFLKTDIMTAPIPDKSVDMVFSEGVLHHTDDTEKAIQYLSQKLRPGGLFLFYVYARKGPIREFTDDLIRHQLAPLKDEEAWAALESLTKLGIALAESKCEIDVPEDVPLLGIKAGKVDLQRLFYWHVCKMFHRFDYTFDQMNHINFDWFRPINCHRHTPGEVAGFCTRAGLQIERQTVELSGITVVARRT